MFSVIEHSFHESVGHLDVQDLCLVLNGWVPCCVLIVTLCETHSSYCLGVSSLGCHSSCKGTFAFMSTVALLTLHFVAAPGNLCKD